MDIEQELRQQLREHRDQVPAPAGSLEGISRRATVLRRRRVAVGLLVAGVAVAGLVVPLRYLAGLGPDARPAIPADEPTVAPAVPEDTQIVLTFVYPDGRPMAGAAVGIHLDPYNPSCHYTQTTLATGRTDSKGRFGFTLADNEAALQQVEDGTVPSMSINSSVLAVDPQHDWGVNWRSVLPVRDQYRETITANDDLSQPEFRGLRDFPDEAFVGPQEVSCVRHGGDGR
jgi:hypothetical protein